MYSQNTPNAKRFCSAQGNGRPEKTEGAVVLIPFSWPVSVIAHQLLILDMGGVVPVALFWLNGVYLHLSPLRELSDAGMLGVWGAGMFSSLTEWQRLYGKTIEDLVSRKKVFILKRETQVLVSAAYDAYIIPACAAFCWQNYLFLLSPDCLV